MDQNLKLFGAHNATTAVAFLEADPSLSVIAHRDCVIEHPRIRKVFAFSFNAPEVCFPGSGNAFRSAVGTVRAIWRNNAMLLRDLREYAGRPGLQLWIWRDGDSRNAYAALWLAWRKRKSLRIVLYFHNQPSRFLMRPFSWLLRGSGICNLRCVHEDESLARKFTSICGVECGVLPFPVPLGALPEPVPESDRRLLVGVLGSPRLEKGIDLVAQVIPRMADALRAGDVRFAIQAQQTGDPSIAPVRAELHAVAESLPNVRLYETPLGTDEYGRLLDEVDVLLMPYRREAYALRNSGVVVEGIAGAKIILLTEGTLMAEHAQEAGVVLLLRDGDLDSLEGALREVLRRLPELRVRARECAARYVEGRDPAKLLDRMEALFEKPAG